MSPRGYAHRVDDNQSAIVLGLRRAGYRVEVLSRLGKGVPDLLVGKPSGQLALVEVKNGREGLTDDERQWHQHWHRFPVLVARSLAEALELLGHECTRFEPRPGGRYECVECGRELSP